MGAPDTEAAAFHAVDLIRTKRDGGELSDAQIDWLITAYTADHVADEQMAAFAMAVLFRGLNGRELNRWTQAMINTGERLDFSDIPRPKVDKHSTGGVGDKITLPLAPLVAACGVAVPQVSGRGLGHTGGTLDKLESIPGWRASLTYEEMQRQLNLIDRLLFPLRPKQRDQRQQHKEKRKDGEQPRIRQRRRPGEEVVVVDLVPDFLAETIRSHPAKDGRQVAQCGHDVSGNLPSVRKEESWPQMGHISHFMNVHKLGDNF